MCCILIPSSSSGLLSIFFSAADPLITGEIKSAPPKKMKNAQMKEKQANPKDRSTRTWLTNRSLQGNGKLSYHNRRQETERLSPHLQKSSFWSSWHCRLDHRTQRKSQGPSLPYSLGTRTQPFYFWCAHRNFWRWWSKYRHSSYKLNLVKFDWQIWLIKFMETSANQQTTAESNEQQQLHSNRSLKLLKCVSYVRFYPKHDYKSETYFGPVKTGSFPVQKIIEHVFPHIIYRLFKSYHYTVMKRKYSCMYDTDH